MIFRIADASDAESIALLHAESWRDHYRGIFLDEYLDGPVFEDRRQVWKTRFETPPANQWALVAEENGKLIGFVCAFGEEDPVWGAYVDNLHVHPTRRGQGIGKILMRKAAQWIVDTYPQHHFYLWVLDANHSSRAFYEKIGGRSVEKANLDTPGGGFADCWRVVWADAGVLL